MGGNVQPKSDFKIPEYAPSEKVTVKQYDGMWDLSKKKDKSETKTSKTDPSELLKIK